MMNTNAFHSCSPFCNGTAGAASFDARIMNALVDTARILAVSICVIILLGVRLHLPLG